MREETIHVDLYDPSLPELLTLKQGDSTRLHVYPTAHKEPFTAEGATVYLCALRPDCTAVIQRSGITVEDGVVHITLDSRILALAGTVFCEILFYSGEELISTFRLPISVCPSSVSEQEASTEALADLKHLLVLLEQNLALDSAGVSIEAGHLPVVSAAGGWEDSGKAVTDFAAAGHTHSNYAAADHTHTGFASADHVHAAYAAADHTHTEYQSATVSANPYFTATTVEGILIEIGQLLTDVDSALAAML